MEVIVDLSLSGHRFLMYFSRSQQEAMKHILQSRVALVQGHEKSDLVVLMMSSIFSCARVRREILVEEEGQLKCSLPA